MAYLELYDSKTLALKCEYMERELAKACGDYKWDRESKRWIFPLSREVVENAKREFDGIAIEPAILTKLSQMSAFQTKVQKIKKMRDCTLDESFIKTTLYPHQRVGVRYCQEFQKAAIFDEMGLGKTLQCIYLTLWRKMRGELEKCIILAPKSCKTTIWLRQIEKFTDEKGLVVEGTKKKRMMIYDRFSKEDFLFLIFGYETFRVDFETLRTLKIINSENGSKVNMMILDEIQKVKSPKTQITKAVKNVQVDYALGLTGTPVFNRIPDLFQIMDIIKPGLLGSNFWKFSDQFLVLGGYGNHQVIDYKNLPELKAKVSSVSIRRLKEQVISLPEKIYETRELEISDPEQKRVYREMAEELNTWIEDMDGNEVRVRAGEILGRNIKLSQIANGFLMGKDLKTPKWFKSSKVEELDEIVDSYSGIVIFTRWLACIDYLYKRYKEKYNAGFLSGSVKDSDRVERIDAFQKGESQVMIAQIVVGGLGIDLSAAKIGVFMDKAFLSPGVLYQAEARIHRPGLREACIMIDLLVKGTIDERWAELMEQKQKMAAEVISTGVPRMEKKDWLFLTGKG